MYVQCKCYKCGGFLAVDDTQDASVCPFCNKAFVVEKAIECFREAAPQDEEKKEAPDRSDSDFVVEHDVLVHYIGYTKTDIRVPDGIRVIGETAFQGMNNIESVQIPEGVELISEGAFSGCKNLRYVQIPDSVTTIDRDGFNGCSSLKVLRLPDTIRCMEAGTFAGCTSLESVNIPQGVETLPWRIFEGCTSLKTIRIPKQIKTIEDCAFAECTELENVFFECMDTEDDSAEGIRRIGMNAFRNCTSLDTIDLPESLNYIGNQAFRGCTKLEALRIPKSIKAIYPLAFADCTGLKEVSFEGDTELYRGSNPYKYENNSATFFNCPNLMTVTYNKLQKNYWAFPAYIQSQEPVFIENGKCRYCGGEFKGVFNKVCAVCKAPKDY